MTTQHAKEWAREKDAEADKMGYGGAVSFYSLARFAEELERPAEGELVKEMEKIWGKGGNCPKLYTQAEVEEIALGRVKFAVKKVIEPLERWQNMNNTDLHSDFRRANVAIYESVTKAKEVMGE